MNRQDWVFVGVRLLGVYLLAEGLVALPLGLGISARTDFPLLLQPFWRLGVGLALFVFAGRLSASGEHSSPR